MSSVVHRSPSSHSVPTPTGASAHVPSPLSHTLTRHGSAGASHVTTVAASTTQLPSVHVSVPLHGFPSS